MDLPGGFMDLATAYRSADETFVSIIGAVVDLMEPTKSRGSSYMFSFKLLDERLSRAIEGSQGLTCRFFMNDLDSMPKVRRVGDMVLLRNVKVVTRDVKMVISNYQTEATVFPAETIPSKAFSIKYKTGKDLIPRHGIPRHIEKLDLAEQEYVIHVNEAMRTFVDLASERSGNGSRPLEDPAAGPAAKRQKIDTVPKNPKLKAIKDLRGGEKAWADIYAFVVKTFGTPNGCDLYVTDYTENQAVRRYTYPEEEVDSIRDGDVYGYNGPKKKAWKGPWGYHVYKVNLKGPHARFANGNLSEGDVVLLKNVKMRVTPENAFLEGDMWPDDKYPEKIQIQKLKNLAIPEVQEMMARKEKYWTKRNARIAQQEATKVNMSKKEKKRQKKQEKRVAKMAENGSTGLGTDHAALATRPRMNPVKTNPSVQCAHEEVNLTRVKDILDPANSRHTNEAPDGSTYTLPFINARYRARVRVVDYEPKILEDFVISSELIDESSPHKADWAIQSPTYEWFFSLLLEDAILSGVSDDVESHRIWVHVHHDSAQWLFGSTFDDPDDLRHNPKLLARVREKMFILWGNLEETGGVGQVSNTPFECCIQEYGVELDDYDKTSDESKGWKRMHSLFGVTIR
ncbi:Protection of telomeres protein 1 [Pseudocercospora fuligena]|uniref:Protection of telomeres protein 1 n=1 Tax=Pseudocercospora fuligena TaxID=685502 RepID=A0A8H6VNB3_9PEZI|nr:Protection of telomeres protein 1 [Pseudocercospora fuligena]